MSKGEPTTKDDSQSSIGTTADFESPRENSGHRAHPIAVRIWHWTNAVALLVLLMSGLMIFNAHPRLYWGSYGANFDPAWLEIGTDDAGAGDVRIGSLTIPSDGFLGRQEGAERPKAFPGWMTIPSRYSLSDARLWHLAFAWVFAVGLTLFMLWSLIGRHVRRDLKIGLSDLSPRQLWADIRSHVRLDFSAPPGQRFNPLQKLSYVGVIFIALPLMIFTGLAMSPGMDAAWPWLLDIFGGRQSARSIHFIVAWSLVAFFFVHVLLVLLSGPIGQIRSMTYSGRKRATSGEGATP